MATVLTGHESSHLESRMIILNNHSNIIVLTRLYRPFTCVPQAKISILHVTEAPCRERDVRLDGELFQLSAFDTHQHNFDQLDLIAC